MSIVKKSKRKKRAANEQNNKQQNEKESKKNKTHRIFIWNVSVFTVENSIKSETELFPIAYDLRHERRILQILFYLA